MVQINDNYYVSTAFPFKRLNFFAGLPVFSSCSRLWSCGQFSNSYWQEQFITYSIILVPWPLPRTLHLYQVYQCIFHFSYCLDYTRGVMHFCDWGLAVNREFLNWYLIIFWKHFKAVCWKVWTNLRIVVLNCTQIFFVAANTILQSMSWHVCHG